MLSIQINKNADLQLDIAAAYVEILPNRIAAARSSAMELAKKELKNKLPQLGNPAKYLVVNVEGFGPVGATIRVAPQKSYRTGKHGYDRGVAASVFLSGRRSGRIITAKSGGKMKLRPGSVSEGYPPFLKRIKLGAIKSHKDAVRRMVKDTTLKSLRSSFKLQGFGPRGGIQRPRIDAPTQVIG
jgi:hypothetical protein